MAAWWLKRQSDVLNVRDINTPKGVSCVFIRSQRWSDRSIRGGVPSHIDTDAFRDLDACARLTYFALLPFVGKSSQQCWPKIKKLAAIIGYHEVSVKKAIRALSDSGFISVGKREFSKARRVNLYTLLEPPIDQG